MQIDVNTLVFWKGTRMQLRTDDRPKEIFFSVVHVSC